MSQFSSFFEYLSQKYLKYFWGVRHRGFTKTVTVFKCFYSNNKYKTFYLLK